MYIKGFAIYVALFAVACACAIIAVLGYKFWRSRRQRIYLAELEKEFIENLQATLKASGVSRAS